MVFTQSLKKNFQFRFVYNKGKSIANRSHVTRLIKESYRLSEENIAAGYDIVVIARVSAANASYHEIEKALLGLLKKHGLLKENKN